MIKIKITVRIKIFYNISFWKNQVTIRVEVGDLIEIVLEFLVSIWEILLNFKISFSESFFKYLRKIGMLVLPKINWACTALWKNFKLSEKFITFFIKVCEWVAIFSSVWVAFYKQLLCYFYFICQIFILATHTAIKLLFDFDFKASYNLAKKSCHLNFNLIYQCFLIFYNMYLFATIVFSIKIYSLFSFLSGNTEKILISEVFFKFDNFWSLSEHDYFGNSPVLIKYLDNFYNSVRYFCLESKPAVSDKRNSLTFTSELDVLLKSLSKSYESLFFKSCFRIKTWVMEVYAIFFALIHVFFKLLNIIISMFYIFADGLAYFTQII